QLATAEAQGDFDLVTVVEKALHRAHLHVVVMIIDARSHLDLFDFDDLLPLACLGGLFLLLVLEFAVVEHLGHGRTGVGGYLHQIEPRSHGSGEGVGNRHHANIVTILIDQPDFADPDVLVYPWTGWLALWRGPHWASYWAVSFDSFRH